MLYYNFNNYEEFKELFGLVKHGNGVKSRKNKILLALDAMGGDNAPAEIVKGAVDAVSSREDIKVFLVGQEDVVREELQKYPCLLYTSRCV